MPSLLAFACAGLAALLLVRGLRLVPFLQFVWHCFLSPIGSGDQKSRLDKVLQPHALYSILSPILTRCFQFYQGQAAIYDSTRHKLLRGRRTMLSLAASHIRAINTDRDSERLVWVDIGGGTGASTNHAMHPTVGLIYFQGHNLELMDRELPISTFSHVYIIDLCEPLLTVARRRIAERGWTNVTVLCQDAAEFQLPEWPRTKGKRDSVSFVTLSYSLSMVRLWRQAPDTIADGIYRYPLFMLSWTESIASFIPIMVLSR